MKIQNIALALITICLSISGLFGQETGDKSRQLDFMVGDWKVEAKIKNSENSYIHGSGTMKVHFEKETLLADMRIKFENFDVNGTTKRNFDKAAGEWNISWNPETGPVVPAIEGKMLDGRFIEINYGKDGRGAFIGRLVIFNISKDKFSVRKDRLYDDGALLKDIWVYEATRIPAKSDGQ